MAFVELTTLEPIPLKPTERMKTVGHGSERRLGKNKIQLGPWANKNILTPLNNAPANDGFTSGSSKAYSIAEGMGLKEEAKNFSDVEMIWRRLEEKIIYPIDLAYERVEGNVDIDFTLSEEGKIIELHSIKGENGLLNTFSTASLLEAFSYELPRKLKNIRTFSCRFIFRIILTETDRNKISIPHFKNLLAIERVRLMKPKTIETMEYYFNRMPIKPTPVGPFIDFAAFYQLYRDTMYADPNAIRKQRIIQDLELWDKSVKNFMQHQSQS